MRSSSANTEEIREAVEEYTVDSALGPLEERFHSLSETQEKFEVLVKFNNVEKISSESLERLCAKVETTLRHQWT